MTDFCKAKASDVEDVVEFSNSSEMSRTDPGPGGPKLRSKPVQEHVQKLMNNQPNLYS